MRDARRAHFLLIAVVLMGLLGTTLYLGTMSFQSLTHRAVQAELDAVVAQHVADAQLWIAQHPERINDLTQEEPITLAINAPTPTKIESEVRILRTTNPDGLRIEARVHAGRQASQLSVDLNIDKEDE